MSIARVKRGGYIEAEAQYVQAIALPDPDEATRVQLGALSEANTEHAVNRFALESGVRHRILTDLAPAEHAKLSRKLEEWWTLDFVAFRDQVKRTLHTEIPVKERGEWEAYLANKSKQVRALTAQIETAERDIDAIVYRSFGLTPDEVKLLEGSIERHC